MSELAIVLANITGNIPCVCFLASGVYLIKSGYFGTGLFLLITAACTAMSYKKSSNKESEGSNEHR